MTGITIISGFLGVGKTTFANIFLDYYIRTGKKVAFVVNEFGMTGLDSALIGQKGFNTVDIFGGCICCTLRGKITVALREVIEKYSPDQIVFEPSGVFVFEKFLEILEDPFLKDNIRIDSVITIVDSNHTPKAICVPGNFFSNQIAHADALVLSKLETFNGDVDELIARLKALNENAAIVSKPFGDFTDADFAGLALNGGKAISQDGEHSHGHAHMDSYEITPKEFNDELIGELGEKLKAKTFGELYRIKGKIILNAQPKLLQVSFDSINIDDNPPDGKNLLTFIGRHLDEQAIRDFFL